MNLKKIIIPALAVLIGLIAIGLRLYINFSTDLIPGINGAYYPLQVRHILQYGTLAFNDMPFIFYFDAAIIKIISLFGVEISNSLIVFIVKFVDSVAFPLSLIPLFFILKNNNKEVSPFFKISIFIYSAFTIASLIMASDLQKNALAIVFLYASINAILKFLNSPSIKRAIWPFIWILLTALTHFGTFSFLMSFVLIFLIFRYRKKAILPMVLFVALGLSVIAMFDLTRFYRLISVFWVAFDMPLVFFGILRPPEIIQILFSFSLAIFGLIFTKRNLDNISRNQRGIVFTSSIMLIICANPFLGIEYYNRLSLFLFIPQILILYFTSDFIKKQLLFVFSVVLISVSVITVVDFTTHLRLPVINHQEYADLEIIKQKINHEETNIILARHGLEWWTAWVTETKVGHEQSVDDKLPDNYSIIYFLQQKRMHYPDGPPQKGHVHELVIPENTIVVYESNLFILYQLVK